MDYCIANEFESSFYESISKGELRKVKTELKKVKTELEASKTSLEQLERENVWLKENLENTSKNQDNIMIKIDSFAHFSSQEEIFFDYGLGNSMTSSGWEIVKFNRQRAVSTTKIYDDSTGKVIIEEGGLYYFYTHG